MNKSALVSSTNNACKKFTQFNPYLTSYDQAILYLKLRKDGCNRRSALLFSKKQMCRSDVTKEIDGPSCCRTLTPDNADHIFCQNGWDPTGHHPYILKKQFRIPKFRGKQLNDSFQKVEDQEQTEKNAMQE